jgi:predicted acyltransferase
MKSEAHHLASLDVFRGLAVASMIVVNNPGAWDSVFAPLQHAAWNHVAFADFVFPCFIFIMGVAIPFAFRRHAEEGRRPGTLHGRIASRVVVLAALGLLLNFIAGSWSLADLRIPGVLQRIAVVYLVTAVLVLHTRTVTWAVIATGLLLIHWAALVLMPFAGHAGGVVSAEQNLSAYIDAALFGSHRLMPLDPEGALGTLSAVSLALVGALAGHWLRIAVGDRRRIAGLALGGLVLLAVGLGWSHVLPLNKPLWTGSFTLVTAGTASLALAACYGCIDTLQLRAWARPFVWLGANPLVIYGLSEATGHLMDRAWIPSGLGQTTTRSWVFWQALEPWAGATLSATAVSLLFAVAFTAIWIGAAGILHSRHIRIRV